MGIIQDARETYSNIRSLSTIKQMLQNLNIGREPDFFDTQATASFINTSQDVVGITDNAISPIDIYDMIHKDTYFTALFEQLQETLFAYPYYIEVAKDENGNTLGSKIKAKQYEDMLKNIGYEDLIIKQVYGERADGGGNVLLFTVKKADGTIEFKAEPFIDTGKVRVKVYADPRIRKIGKYEVIDNAMQPVYTIDADKSYYRHVRYTPAGDFRFSGNPAKRAVYWFVLKKYLAGANLSSFKNGFQKTTIATPDLSVLTGLVNALSTSKVSDSSKADYLRDPIKYLSNLSMLDDEVLRTINGNARKTNSLLKFKLPMKFDVVGNTNKDMETIKLIELCDDQMGYALRTSKGLINTKDSKYSNAETESDNWSNLVVDPLKRKIEKITEEFYLPALDAEYNPDIYKVRFGRNPDDEDIAIYEAKTARNTAEAAIIVSLSGTNYEYDLQNKEIIKKGEQAGPEKELNNDEIVEGQHPNIDDNSDNKVEDMERYYLYAYEAPELREDFEMKRDRVYAKYHSTVNMNRSELDKWSRNDCSMKVGADRAPVRRNLELLDTLKKDWTARHISWANKTVGFINRMNKNLKSGNEIRLEDGTACGTRAVIAVKNWGFDPGKKGKASDYKTEIKRSANEDSDEFKGIVMAKFVQDNFLKTRELFNKDDLVESDFASDGYPDEYHATILFGINPITKSEDIKKSLEGINNLGKDIEAGDITIFENPDKDYDVIVLRIESNTLQQAYKALKESTDNVQTFPTYKPHITLAYVTKGKGQSYKNINLDDLKIELDSIVYNANNGSDVAKIRTLIRVKKKREVTEEAIDSPEASKFYNIVQTALNKQLKTYTENLKKRKSIREAMDNIDKDLPPITTMGLPVNTYKQQLLKFAKRGVDEFNIKNKTKTRADNFSYPQSVVDMMDAKAQLMTKGYNSLNKDQQKLVTRFFGRELKNYKGMSSTTTERINTILRDSLDEDDGDAENNSSKGVDKAVERMMDEYPEMARSQAESIGFTEVAQSIEATRFNMYSDAGYDEKSWFNVGDSKVRQAHRDYEEMGWIPIDEPFDNGEHQCMSPSEEIYCRCTARYRKSGNSDQEEVQYGIDTSED